MGISRYHTRLPMVMLVRLKIAIRGVENIPGDGNKKDI